MAAATRKGLAAVLSCVLLGSPPAAAADESIESSWMHPGLAAGVGLGWAKEVTTCSTRGVFACPLPDERERSLGFQAAPAFDALVMFGKRRRPQSLLLGVGVRYAPALLLDTGDELHFAVIPEVRGEIGRELELTFRFFNTMGKTFPGRGVGDAQAPVLAACGAISGVSGASCSTIANTLL